MFKRLNNLRFRFILLASLGAPALLVWIAGYYAWDNWRNYTMVRTTIEANTMADNIIAAAGLQALERGVTSSLLSGSGPAPETGRQRLAGLRVKSDTLWQNALAIAGLFEEQGVVLEAAVLARKQAAEAYRELVAARVRVDSSLVKTERDIQAAEWIPIMTRFIAAAARLRLASFGGDAFPPRITYPNLTVKHSVWLASEYAGIERATIAALLNSNAPATPDVLQRLRAFRQNVETSLADIRFLKEVGNTAPEVRVVIEAMEKNFLGSFEAVRRQIYQEAVLPTPSGNRHYTLSSAQWIEQSTAAIDTILAISDAYSHVSNREAEVTARLRFIQMWGYIGLFIAIIVVSFLMVTLLFNKLAHLDNLRDSMTELAGGQGDLTFRLHADSTDEIGQTSSAFNQFAAKLRDIIAESRSVVEQLGATAGKLTAASDKVNKGSHDQGEMLVATAAAVEKITTSIGHVAARALDGDGACYEQLVSLRDTKIAESYARLGIPEPRQLMGNWAESWQRYEQGWQQLQEAGAPGARPDDRAAFPALVRLWLSVDQRQKLFDNIEECSGAVRYLLRRDWYFALGHDFRALPVEYQWILDSLDQSSLVETLMYSQSHRDLVSMELRESPTVTDEQLMQSVLYSETTQRLTRNLVPQYQSRETITLQGAEHPDQRLRPDISDNFLSRLTGPIGRRLRNSAQLAQEWLQRRFRRGGSTASAPEVPPLSISAIRVNLVLPRQHTVSDMLAGDVDRSEPMGQAVLIRWDLPAGVQPTIHIGHAGLFGRRIKRQRVIRLPLRLEDAPLPNALERRLRRNQGTRLPHRGQIILAFFQPTIVWLSFKMPGRRWTTRSQVLRLGAPTIPLLGANKQLREVGRLLAASSKLLETRDTELTKVTELLPLRMKLIPMNDQLRSISEPMGGSLDVSELDPINFQSSDPRVQLPVAAYTRLWAKTVFR